MEPTQSNQLPTGNEIEDQLISKSEDHKHLMIMMEHLHYNCKTWMMLSGNVNYCFKLE